MIAAFFLGFVVATLWIGGLINRAGHIRSFAILAGASTATSLSFLLIPNPWVWVVLRLLMGMCVAGCFVVTESWMNNRATNENRGILLSIYMGLMYLSSAAGQQALQFGDPAKFEIFAFTSILIAVAIIPVAATKETFPNPVPKTKIHLRRLIQTSPTAVAGCLISGFVLSSLGGLGPIYAQSLGLEINGIALFMSIFVIGGLLFQIPVGRLSDHYDRRKVLGAVTAIAILPSLILSFGSLVNATFIFVSIALLGGLIATIYPLSISYANDYLESDEIISTSAGFVLIFGTGAMLGPVIGSVMMLKMGYQSLFILITLALLSLVLYIAWRTQIRQWVPVKAKEAFVALPEHPAPTIISDLDPRTEISSQSNSKEKI
tara:strand:- start:3700 stop:4827 length:1128 start_codon:yes stop_codon:yes gene_type:complete